MQKQWKYDDKICIGCKQNEETGDEILSCNSYGDQNMTKTIKYDCFFSDPVQMVEAAQVLMKRLKIRQKLIDEME